MRDRWEYKVHIWENPADLSPEEFVARLNELGADGWEAYWENVYLVHLKRKIQ